MSGGLSSSRHARGPPSRQPQPPPARISSPLTIVPAGASLNYPPPLLPYEAPICPPSEYQSRYPYQLHPHPAHPPHSARSYPPPSTSHRPQSTPLLPLKPPPSTTLLAAHELSRYTKIVRRLKWKLPFLSTAYAQAIDRVGRDTPSVKEAELMFKLDFFEYYMLLERALVHLQAVWGVVIGRGGGYGGRGREGLAGSLHGGGGGQDVGGGWGGMGEGMEGGGAGRYPHRYHANVLAALDKTDNPLHEVLGTGEVRKQLGRAKDLRNRWKTAGEEEEEGEGNGEGTSAASKVPMMSARKVAAPLESYDLERILKAIFEGFDAAYLVAERYVKGKDEGSLDLMDAEMTISEEEQWEFMVDAMDWEAV